MKYNTYLFFPHLFLLDRYNHIHLYLKLFTNLLYFPTVRGCHRALIGRLMYSAPGTFCPQKLPHCACRLSFEAPHTPGHRGEPLPCQNKHNRWNDSVLTGRGFVSYYSVPGIVFPLARMKNTQSVSF